MRATSEQDAADQVEGVVRGWLAANDNGEKHLAQPFAHLCARAVDVRTFLCESVLIETRMR